MEWTPKGHKETVDKYLKTLPVEQLPVKGSAAAQERKQLLQKQIPVHDIDPTLCHDLTEAELKLMNDYVAHLKENSVGIGHVIQLGLNRGNLHTLGAPTTQILADRCPTQVSNVETVQLQGANSTHLLKSKNLQDKLKNLSLEERKALDVPEQLRNSENATPVRDLRYDCYENLDNNYPMLSNLTNKKISKSNDIQNPEILGDIKDIRYFPGRNLLPENLRNEVPSEQNVYLANKDFSNKLNNIFADTNTNYMDAQNLEKFPFRNPNSLPHYAPSQFNRFAETRNPEKIGNIRDFVANTDSKYTEPLNSEQVRELGSTDLRYLPHYTPSQFDRFAEDRNPEKLGNICDFIVDRNTNFTDPTQQFDIENPKNLPNYVPSNFSRISETKNPEKLANIHDFSAETNTNYDNPEQAHDFTAKDANNLPHYAPSKFNRFAESRNPQKFGNIRDLAFSTYDTSQVNDQALENDFTPPNDNLSRKNRQSSLPEQRLPNVVSKHTPYSKIYPNNPSANIPSQQNYINNFPISNQSNLPYSENYLNNQPANIPKTNQTKFQNNLPQNYIPSNLNVPENIQNPMVVNVGAISDIVYPTAEIKSAEHCDNDIFEPYIPRQEIPNQNLGLTCHRCRKIFEKDAIVIGIERSDILFHSCCFTCAGCNQPLADLMHFYDKETNDIYCGRDYAKVRGVPRCKACDELIFVKEYCLAENSTFHVKHFCCFECDSPLAGQDYVVEDSQPICLPCFEKVKADKCNTCFNLIKPDEAGANLNGVHFHATDACFACKTCKKPLLGSKLLFKNQRLYCSGVCYGVDK